MDEKTIAILRRIYKEFYFRHPGGIGTPDRVSEREFGYMPFGGSMVRHLSFRTDGNLKAFLVRGAPHSIYYSVSFYLKPTLPMDKKGWKGADVVFDIDCDDLLSPCRKIHDRWLCKACGFVGVGIRPRKCFKCGDQRIEELNWVCDTCLTAAKQETLRLLDILTGDFDLPLEKIKIYFSGSMGYHVSVENSELEHLDQTARGELADYVTGTMLLPETLGISNQSTYEQLKDRLPNITEGGWRGRVARFLKAYPLEGYVDDVDCDVRRKFAFLYSKLGYQRLKKFIEEAVKKSGSSIDTTVTTDIHRIFRLPGTLHGETGLMKTKCEDLVKFDPLTDAVVLGEEPLNVWVKHSPEFRLRNQTFGPFKTEKVVLPLMASTYLMARGLAEVI
jgi:DNA primase small subunit